MAAPKLDSNSHAQYCIDAHQKINAALQQEKKSGTLAGKKVTIVAALKNYMKSTRLYKGIVQLGSFISRNIKKATTTKIKMRPVSTFEKVALTYLGLNVWNPLVWPMLLGYAFSLFSVSTKDATVDTGTSCGNGNVHHYTRQPIVDNGLIDTLCKAMQGEDQALLCLLEPKEKKQLRESGEKLSDEKRKALIKQAAEMLTAIAHQAAIDTAKESPYLLLDTEEAKEHFVQNNYNAALSTPQPEAAQQNEDASTSNRETKNAGNIGQC